MQSLNTHKTCKGCGDRYEKLSNHKTFQVWCSLECAVKISTERRRVASERKERKDTKIRKLALKTRSQWLKEAQAVVNKYVRLRDRGKPCISCDWPDDGSNARHASHYRSVGAAPELRFDTEHNIFASCAQCNTMKSGNVVEYRIRLRKLIGDKALDELEGPHPPAKYTIEGIKAIKAAYQQRIKELA
jgi:hypothetical protein